MSFRYTPFALLLFISAALSLALALYAWRHRDKRLASTFALVNLALAWWSFTYGMHVAGNDFNTQYFFNRIKYLGVLSVPSLWLWLAYQYTHSHHSLSKRQKWLLLAPVLIFFPLVLSDPLTHAWWPKMWAEDFHGLLIIGTSHSLFYFVATIIAYLFILWGLILYIRFYRQSAAIYRSQALLMIFSGSVPAVANILTQLGLNPLPWGLDPFFFLVASLLLSLAIFRYGLLDILPIARQIIMEQLPDGVIVLNSNQIIADINPAAAHLIENTANQAIGQPLEKANQNAEFGPSLVEILQPGSSTEIEFHLTRPERYFLMKSAPLKQEQNSLGEVLLLHDITLSKKAEKELEQARDEALSASRMKSRLLANVSHDLRTPLGAMLGYTEMLVSGVYGDMTDEQKNVMVSIIESTNQLLDFINNLIGQAEIETGKLILNIQPFEPRQLFQSIQGVSDAMARSKNLDLKWEVAPDVPKVLTGDVYWLQHITANLVNNALKFTEKGTIICKIYREDQEHWGIQVADTGIGIPPEEQEDIFNAFQQGNQISARKFRIGSGLGLSIVKELSILMSGQVILESAPEEGSVFKAIFPLAVN